MENAGSRKKLLDIEMRNCVKTSMHPFTQEEISRKIVEMLTADGSINAEVDIIYQTLEGQRRGNTHVPATGISGDYPTPGGVRLVNRAYVQFT